MDINPRENPLKGLEPEPRPEHFLVGLSPVRERNERMEALETHRAGEESQHLQCSGAAPEPQGLPPTNAGKHTLPLTGS